MGYELLDIEFFDSYDGWEASDDIVSAYTDYASSDEYDEQEGVIIWMDLCVVF